MGQRPADPGGLTVTSDLQNKQPHHAQARTQGELGSAYPRLPHHLVEEDRMG